MIRIKFLVLLLAPLLGGCDIALGIYFATRGHSPPPGPDLTYHVFVKNITSGDETNQQNMIIAANGNPTVTGWIEIGAASSTAEFALPTLSTFNAILVGASVRQAYNIESLILLDANGNTTEVASGTTYASLVGLPNNILGLPDGLVATTQADATHDAFVFTLYGLANSPTTLRVNIWGTSPGSGDVDLAQIQARAGIQRAGGVALKKDGSLYGMAKDDFGVRAVILLKFPPGGGTAVTNAAIEPNPVTTSAGNNTVVIDQSTTPDSVYVGTTYSGSTSGTGLIHVMKLEGPGTTWTQTIGTQGVCRIEAHGLALDSAGDLLVAGGVDWGSTNGGLGPVVRKLSQTDGSQLWLSPPGRPEGALGPFDLNGDYYFGVTAQAGDFWTTGTLQQTPPAGFRQVYVERRDGSTSNNGALRWSDYADGPSPLETSPDGGNAVAADPQGNVYVGGYFTVSGPAKQAIIFLYPGGNPPHTATPFFVSSFNSDSEILDLKVDSVGGQNFIYATGYETVTLGATSRKNVFIMKVTSGGSLIWKRNYNGGFGDDRGVSLALDSAHVWVWGETSVSATDVDVFYLRLVK
jgi:hypothetical protein